MVGHPRGGQAHTAEQVHGPVVGPDKPHPLDRESTLFRFAVNFPDPLMTKSDVANLLRCCERTVERQVKLCAFPPPQRFGKESLWFQSIVFGWLDKRREAQQQWFELGESKPAAELCPVPDETPKEKIKKKGGRPAKPRAAELARQSVFTPEQLSSIGRSVEID